MGWRLPGACARARPPAGENMPPVEINAAVFGVYLVCLVVYSQISVCSLVIWLFGDLQIFSSFPCNTEVAWKVAGQGGPKGSPPYKVGYRIFEMNHDGTFPRGVVRYADGPAQREQPPPHQ